MGLLFGAKNKELHTSLMLYSLDKNIAFKLYQIQFWNFLQCTSHTLALTYVNYNFLNLLT